MLVHRTFEESFVLNSYQNFLCITNYANKLSKSEHMFICYTIVYVFLTYVLHWGLNLWVIIIKIIIKIATKKLHLEQNINT